MATIAIGDIHGNLPALDDLLRQIRPDGVDGNAFVFLGDYIDGGSQSRGCVDAILRFQREVSAEVVCLTGNHEEWLLRTMHDYGRHSWLFAASPYDTIRSYSADAARRLREAASQAGAQLYSERCELPYEIFFDCLPREHVEFFEGLRRYHRTADCLCTHGGLDPLVPRLEDQTPHALIWGTSTFPAGYEGSEIVVYGHRNNAELNGEGWPVPRVVGRTIGIDTIKHGVLTAIRLPDGRLFQSARHDVAEPDA